MCGVQACSARGEERDSILAEGSHPSAAKAGFFLHLIGTAEAVPLQSQRRGAQLSAVTGSPAIASETRLLVGGRCPVAPEGRGGRPQRRPAAARKRFAERLFPRPEGSIRLAGLCRLAQDRLWLLASSSYGGPDVDGRALSAPGEERDLILAEGSHPSAAEAGFLSDRIGTAEAVPLQSQRCGAQLSAAAGSPAIASGRRDCCSETDAPSRRVGVAGDPKDGLRQQGGALRRGFFPRPEGSVRLAGLRRLAQDRLWLLPSSSCGDTMCVGEVGGS